MHPFFSYPISQIRSVCIISYPFHMKWSPAVANIGWYNCCPVRFFQTHSPFPSLPRSLFLIQTQFAFSHKDVLAKYISKIAFSSASVNFAFCTLLLFVCVVCFFFSFILTQKLQSWRRMNLQLPHSMSQRTNSKGKTQSSKMFQSKKATRDWQECSLRKSGLEFSKWK